MSNDRAKHFQFDRFDQNKEEWQYYIQRFETELILFEINGTDANTIQLKRNILLSKMGPDAFKMLVDHFRPGALTTKTYEEIKSAMDGFFGRKVCIISERREFNLRMRSTDESVSQFVNNLRSLAGNCEFGATLTERIRDQLVIGINNSQWQHELIRSFPNNASSLADVESAALLLEQATVQARRLETMTAAAGASSNVNAVQRFKAGERKRYQSTTTKRVQILDPKRQCLKCGYDLHNNESSCPANGKKCGSCGAENHFARVCISSGNAKLSDRQTKRSNVRKLQADPDNSQQFYGRKLTPNDDEDDQQYSEESCSEIGHVRAINSVTKVLLPTIINGYKIDMLYDPGAAYSVISEKIWKKIGAPQLLKTKNLIAYTNLEVETLGRTTVRVSAFDKNMNLELYVVKRSDIPLFGLNWSLSFNIPLPPGAKLCTLKAPDSAEHRSGTDANDIKHLLCEYKNIFSGTIGVVNGHPVHIHILPTVSPVAFRPRPVAIALQESVRVEIQRLLNEGVLEPVDTTTTPITWATPVVVAIKSNGSVRICGDFRVTINPHVQQNQYPLPLFEDLAAKLAGGAQFSRIDLKDAYLQLPVHPESRKYLTVATNLGYFRYTRLPFGVSFAPSLFQNTMDQLLGDLQGVACFLDDILVTAPSRDVHLHRLALVFKRLDSAGFRTQSTKCVWLQDRVQFLGHVFDKNGIHPTTERIDAIRNLPRPSNVKELKSFVSSVAFCSKFIPNLQIICAPLYEKLRKNVKWQWTFSDDAIYDRLRNQLSSTDTLVHFNNSLPVVLSTDASEKGVGAVLFHRYPNSQLKPVAYASRTFGVAERNYSTIDKEALGIVFGVKRFHQYLYGRTFTLLCDHKPLEQIFGEKSHPPKVAANRLYRWALLLGEYSFSVKHINGHDNAMADVLSRLPQVGTAESSSIEEMGSVNRAHLMRLRLRDLPITKRELQAFTNTDDTICRVIKCQQGGWPSKEVLSDDIRTYFEKRDEISFEEGILLWKGRIVVPKSLRNRIMDMLHDGHPGISAMQSTARLHLYWPGFDNEIANYVNSCESCQETKPHENYVPLYPWNAPSEPWARIHIDFAGPFENKMWLIIIDAYSRWVEIFKMADITTASTISKLFEVFARLGLPKLIVSDNGPQLTSAEFEDFCGQNGIVHIKTTPYHPKTNGLAERTVRTFKERMLAMDRSICVDERLQRFLFSYRNNVQRSTKRSPSSLIYGRQLRSVFDQIKPDVARNMDVESVKMKNYYDTNVAVTEKVFGGGDNVWVKNPLDKFCSKGVILKQNGPYSYEVSVGGVIRRKHADQLRKRCLDPGNHNITNDGNADTAKLTGGVSEAVVQEGLTVLPNVESPTSPVMGDTCGHEVESRSPVSPSVDCSTSVREPVKRNPFRKRELPARFRP